MQADDSWKPALTLRSRERQCTGFFVRPLPQDNWQPAGTPRQLHEDCLLALEGATALLRAAQRDIPFDPISLRIFVGCTRVLAKTASSAYRPFALAKKPNCVRFANRSWPSFHHAAVWNCEQLLVDLETGIAGLGKGGTLRAMPLLDFVALVVNKPDCVQGLRLHEFRAADLREQCAIEASWLRSEDAAAPAPSSSPAPFTGPTNDRSPAPLIPEPSTTTPNNRSKAVLHVAREVRSERYTFGPLAGTRRELAYALDPRAQTSDSNLHRRLLYAASSDRFWIVSVRRQLCEVYFETNRAFLDAQQRLAEFRALTTKTSKRVK